MLLETLIAAQVLVNVDVETPEGDLYVQLCSEDTYMQTTCEHQAIQPAQAQLSFAFEDVAPGQWAVMVWRDPEGDGEMATNLFGIPAEPVAIYGDPRALFGAPSFSDSAVEIGEGEHAFNVGID